MVYEVREDAPDGDQSEDLEEPQHEERSAAEHFKVAIVVMVVGCGSGIVVRQLECLVGSEHEMVKMTMWTGPRHSLNTMSPLAERSRTGTSRRKAIIHPVACCVRLRTKFYQGQTDLKPQHPMTLCKPGQPIGQTEIAAAEMGKRRVRRCYRAEHRVLTTDAGEQSKVFFFLVRTGKSRPVDGVKLSLLAGYVRWRMTYVGLPSFVACAGGWVRVSIGSVSVCSLELALRKGN